MTDERVRSTSCCRPTIAGPPCAADAEAGLTASPKTLPPMWFYDERGSELFDEITRLARVLPDRARAGDPRPSARGGDRRPSRADTLVELGSGTSDKTRLLLDAMARRRSVAPLRARST